MGSPLLQFLARCLVLALGVTLATRLVPGIHCDDAVTLVAVVMVLSFFNAFLKPLLVLVALPFILVTMGLGIILINALLFYFAGRLVEGFHVDGFRAALGGALVVSGTNLLLGLLMRRSARAAARARKRDDGVIDI